MKIYSQIRKLASVLAVSGLLMAGASVQAAYPERPVTLVVPLSAGGVTDTVARLLGKGLADELGQPVVVENKPGAGGAIGAEHVANAKADGYTLVMGTVSSHAINPSVYKSLRYDNIKDFTPLSLIARGPNLLVVHPSVPANTVPELIQWIKDNPGKISYGSTGVGTSTHLGAELFKQMTGVDMVHVPYKGSAPMMTDLISGQVQLAFDNMPTALAQVKGGKLKAIAVTSKEPWPLEPGIPTIDASLPGYEIVSWQGVFAPASTPSEIVEKLSTTSQKIMQAPEMIERLHGLGTNAVGSSNKEFTEFVAAETKKWASVAKEAGVELE